MTKSRKPLALSIGAAVVGSAALTGVANAENPFELRDLPSGYLQLASNGDGKAATPAPAPAADKSMEGRCGEGKCGAGMRSGAEATPAAADKAMEGKCGEGKCGAGMRSGAKAAPAAADKAMEGKCGEGRCGSSMKK
jgi:uncharacterized low-complexity protein